MLQNPEVRIGDSSSLLSTRGLLGLKICLSRKRKRRGMSRFLTRIQDGVVNFQAKAMMTMSNDPLHLVRNLHDHRPCSRKRGAVSRFLIRVKEGVVNFRHQAMMTMPNDPLHLVRNLHDHRPCSRKRGAVSRFLVVDLGGE
jgi:hypothetical protein